jgi:hypothetical protein
MRGREMVEVYASGFAEHQGGYFISRENASGVMTGWRTLMGIPAGTSTILNINDQTVWSRYMQIWSRNTFL